MLVIAIQIGSRMSAKSTGAMTSSSSVESHRCCWIEPDAAIVVTDQIPATAEPMDA